MCAINPRRERHFTVSFYTSHILRDTTWDQLTFQAMLQLEIKLNTDGRIRVHVSEADPTKQPE
jgi:hypothetical protein